MFDKITVGWAPQDSAGGEVGTVQECDVCTVDSNAVRAVMGDLGVARAFQNAFPLPFPLACSERTLSLRATLNQNGIFGPIYAPLRALCRNSCIEADEVYCECVAAAGGATMQVPGLFACHMPIPALLSSSLWLITVTCAAAPIPYVLPSVCPMMRVHVCTVWLQGTPLSHVYVAGSITCIMCWVAVGYAPG